MIPKRFRFLLISFACLTAAHAQTERKFSLTNSPIHLALPIFEFTGEYAVAPKFGVAAIGGYGGMELEKSDGFTVTKETIPVLELGAQAMYYPWGDFNGGMQVGAELLWIKLFIPEDEGVVVTANGVAVGPMLGYKWVMSFGLTFVVQGGYQFMFAQAKGVDNTGAEMESNVDAGIPLINLNMGWSF